MRSAPPDTLLAANGTSCRHQIADAAGREARHLVRILDDASAAEPRDDGSRAVFDPLPPDALRRFVVDSLNAHNIATTGQSDWHPVGFFLKNARGEWVGGLLGDLWGGWLHVRILWVDMAVARSRPWRAAAAGGRELCRERGCFAATLETHSFQARPFYEKRGYEVFATLDDYPPGHSKFFLRKPLSRAVCPTGRAS